MPCRITQPVVEASFLLVLADMQEKFEYLDTVICQDLLEGVNLTVPVGPNLRRNDVVDPHDQHVFVVRAVEDPYITTPRHGFVNAPQKVMIQLVSRRFLE